MSDLVLGIDIGTSGVRAVATNAAHQQQAYAAIAMAAPEKTGDAVRQDPEIWWQAVCQVLDDLRLKLDFSRIGAIAIDGTSGTILPIDASGCPLSAASMYNDASAKAAAGLIAGKAPPETAAHGATSPLGRALALQSLPGIARILHQADWISGRLTDDFTASDENNALKTGYDPVLRRWPDWMVDCGVEMRLLPRVYPVGTAYARLSAHTCARFGFLPGTKLVSGTTDGCAAFLATGANRVGDGVTSLGTTLVVKLLSHKPIFAPQFGLYSHRIGDLWLAGGASNSGGAALLNFFSAAQMAALEPQLQPLTPTGLDYYPLSGTGERFPIADPLLQSRVTPRPASDAMFLQGLFEGVAAVEALAYSRMSELGGPKLQRLMSVGGGAKNHAWSAIRALKLGLSLTQPAAEEAAIGAARLAWLGLAGKEA